MSESESRRPVLARAFLAILMTNNKLEPSAKMGSESARRRKWSKLKDKEVLVVIVK